MLQEGLTDLRVLDWRLRLQRLVLSALVTMGWLVISGAPSEACQARALGHLSRHAPQGYDIYRRHNDKADFTRWITCDDIVSGLSTAVHETVHMMTNNIGQYPLVDGRRIARVPETADFYPPRLIAGWFKRTSPFVQTYLMRGQASSADYFRYLLDEFNAYAHDLNTAVGLNRFERRDQTVFHRDGLAALMAFVAAYTEEAYRRRPRTWQALMEETSRSTVATLWEQAENVMAGSCHVSHIGLEAPEYLSRVCTANANHPLGRLLGRPPVCPVRCVMERASAGG